MKSKIYLFFLILSLNLFSQRQADNWYFGNKAGINFKNPNPVILNDGEMNTPAGCASISDREGNLLFYTNGKTVFNKNHQIMENGDNLTAEVENTQTSIIIPIPGSETRFYIFSNKISPSTNPILTEGLYVSEVEISTTYPLGKVLYKYTSIRQSASERITAVHHKDGKSIWLIVFGPIARIENTPTRTFSVYKIDESGLNAPLVTNHETTTSKKGAMKASPDGKYIAVADFGEENIDLYNFNNETGEISLKEKIFTDTALFSPKSTYGLAFSQDSKILYYAAEVTPAKYSSINQWLIENPSPNDPLFTQKKPIINSFDEYFGSLQLASNGKIYAATYIQNDDGSISQKDKITVIQNPNDFNNPDVTHLSLDLETGFSFQGLPNFIQSYFRTRIITENQCVFDTFNFDIDSYAPITNILWDFGDGNTSTQINPSHQYQTSGRFTVKANITINNSVTSIYKNIQVYALPQLTPNVTLEQCDISNDGVDIFDLYDIEERITNPNLEHQFYFYRTLAHAQNDTNRIPNPERFENESNPQEIFVRAISTNGCVSVSNFFIKTTFVQLGAINPIYTCEDSDNVVGNSEGYFDLRIKEREIRNQFNIAPTSRIRFYPSQTDALTTSNELPQNFNSISTNVWLRVDNNTGCGGIEPFQLVVNNTPPININDSYILCYEPSFHNPIVLDGNSFNNRFEWRNENGTIISRNREFTLTTTGNFSLTVYKTENGIECSNYKEFTVSNPNPATFGQITVDTETENNTVLVNVNGNSSYQFSLDNQNFFGNGTSYTFMNVNPGLRTVFVRDLNNCEEPIKTNVSVLGYQKFFSPNGDGDNDFWNVKGIDSAFFKSVNIVIFDRFGRIIYNITDFNSQGWDGTYNGKKLASNNYWFTSVIVDNDDKVIKESGNFSLVR